MKKIDLHIHTVKTAKDSEFTFSIDDFKRYVIDLEIDVAAVTNHNVFDSSQFRLIQQEIPTQVFPGIEIDLLSGHLLLISDGADLASFEAKCAQVSSKIRDTTDSVTVKELKSVFGDLTEYLLIPHYDKSPAVKGADFAEMLPYFSAGEVDSEKKFVRTMRDEEKLCPVLFSDSRIKVGMTELPIRQTFINCGDVTLPAIKSCFKDKGKVFLSRRDGNKLFQVFEDGQHL